MGENEVGLCREDRKMDFKRISLAFQLQTSSSGLEESKGRRQSRDRSKAETNRKKDQLLVTVP